MILLQVFFICILPCAILAVDSFISCWLFLPSLNFFLSQLLQHPIWPAWYDPSCRFSFIVSFSTCIFSRCQFYFVLIISTKPKISQNPSKNALWVKFVESKSQSMKKKNLWVKWCGKNCDSRLCILKEMAWEYMNSHGCSARLPLLCAHKLPQILIKYRFWFSGSGAEPETLLF